MYSRYMKAGGFWEDSGTPPASRSADASRKPKEKAAEHREERREERRDDTKKRGLPSAFSKLFANLDLGDILLIAIIIFLLMESGDMEVVIALAMVVLGWL